MSGVKRAAVADGCNSFAGEDAGISKNFDGRAPRSLDGLSDDLQEIAGPLERNEKIDVILARAVRRTGLSYSRVFNIWYGRAKQVDVEERGTIAVALDKRRREIRRNEYADLRMRLLRIESQLALTDPDFHRDDIAYAQQQRRIID